VGIPATEIRIRSGEVRELPFPLSHPLAARQSLRVATREEVLAVPYYAGLINQRAENESHHAAVVDELIAALGIGWEINLEEYDLIVERNAVLNINGSCAWIILNRFIIEDGGVCNINNPIQTADIPRYFDVRCQVFGCAAH